MDWKIFCATFGAIFLAELADKTQLVGIGMSARSVKPLAVWLGSVSAYIIITAISVSNFGVGTSTFFSALTVIKTFVALTVSFFHFLHLFDRKGLHNNQFYTTI